MTPRCAVSCGQPAVNNFRDTDHLTCGSEVCNAALRGLYPSEETLRRMAPRREPEDE